MGGLGGTGGNGGSGGLFAVEGTDNFYALSHGSLPNYYPIVGSGLGNSQVIDVKNLVSRWYVDLLGRQPDTAGLSSHIRALEAGFSLFEVASALTSSAEFRSLKVRQVYFAALGRDADSAGQEAWVNHWQALGGLAGVTTGILGSAENHTRLISTAGIPLPDVESARQWTSVLQAPYDDSASGFVKEFNRLLQTNPPAGGNPASPPTNTALWNFSRNSGGADGLPDDEKLSVTPSGQLVPFRVANLKPTQNEVDMGQSLKWPLTEPATLEKYLKGGVITHAAGPLITGGNGRFIVDGHHRWSAVFVINPRSSLMSFDFGTLAGPEEYLKVAQIAVGAQLGYLPVATVKPGNNLFIVNQATFRNYVATTIGGNADGGQAILDTFKKYGIADHGTASLSAVQDYLWENVQQLRLNNQPALDVPRPIMPQTPDSDPSTISSWLQSGNLNFKGPVIASLG